MDAVASQIGAEKLVLTESNVEQLIGSVDTFLSLVAYSKDINEIVPAFQYVYRFGAFMTAGAEFFRNDVLESNADMFVRKLMKQFMFGTQLGWFSLGGRSNQVPGMSMQDILMDDTHHLSRRVLLDLLRMRMDPIITQMFRIGGLIDEIGDYGVLWMDNQGFIAIICNVQEDPIELEVELDIDKYAKSEKFDVDVLHDKWTIVAKDINKDDIQSKVQIKARDCATYHIYPSTFSSTSFDILVF